MYKNKYIKYKNKYLLLKNQYGSSDIDESSVDIVNTYYTNIRNKSPINIDNINYTIDNNYTIGKKVLFFEALLKKLTK